MYLVIPTPVGTLIFLYMSKVRLFLGGIQNFEFQYLLGFSEKLIFGGYEDFVDIFFGSSQNWTILRGNSYAF